MTQTTIWARVISERGRLSLRGVLIDFGDTLAYVTKERYKRYVEGLLSIMRRHGYPNSLDDFASSLDNVYYKSSRGGAKNLWDFWELLIKELGVARAPALVEELEEFRSSHFATMFRLYKGAIPVLSTLQKKYRLALVSNCAAGLSDAIKTLGLTSYFTGIILSYEVGARKPDKRIYLKALQSLKLEPNECVFVSDEISDLEGAKEIGLKTLLVRQGLHTIHDAKDPDFKADFQCNRISEVTKFL